MNWRGNAPSASLLRRANDADADELCEVAADRHATLTNQLSRLSQPHSGTKSSKERARAEAVFLPR